MAEVYSSATSSFCMLSRKLSSLSKSFEAEVQAGGTHADPAARARAESLMREMDTVIEEMEAVQAVSRTMPAVATPLKQGAPKLAEAFAGALASTLKPLVKENVIAALQKEEPPTACATSELSEQDVRGLVEGYLGWEFVLGQDTLAAKEVPDFPAHQHVNEAEATAAFLAWLKGALVQVGADLDGLDVRNVRGLPGLLQAEFKGWGMLNGDLDGVILPAESASPAMQMRMAFRLKLSQEDREQQAGASGAAAPSPSQVPGELAGGMGVPVSAAAAAVSAPAGEDSVPAGSSKRRGGPETAEMGQQRPTSGRAAKKLKAEPTEDEEVTRFPFSDAIMGQATGELLAAYAGSEYPLELCVTDSHTWHILKVLPERIKLWQDLTTSQALHHIKESLNNLPAAARKAGFRYAMLDSEEDKKVMKAMKAFKPVSPLKKSLALALEATDGSPEEKFGAALEFFSMHAGQGAAAHVLGLPKEFSHIFD